MMKTTKTEMLITRLILKTDYAITDMGGGTTYRKGRVLKTIRNRKYHYHPTDFYVTMGHGLTGKIPAELIKAKWFIETKITKKTKNATTTEVTTKEIAVK